MKNPAPRPEVTSALLSRLLHNNVDAAQRAVINRTGVKVQARRSTPVAKASPQPPPQELRCASVASRRQCGNVALGAGSGDQVKLCRRHLKARHPRIVARWDKDKRHVRHGNAEAPVFPSDLAQLIRNAPSVWEAAKNARQRPALTHHDAALTSTDAVRAALDPIEGYEWLAELLKHDEQPVSEIKHTPEALGESWDTLSRKLTKSGLFTYRRGNKSEGWRYLWSLTDAGRRAYDMPATTAAATTGPICAFSLDTYQDPPDKPQIRHVATLLGFTLTEQTKQVNAATHTKGL